MTPSFATRRPWLKSKAGKTRMVDDVETIGGRLTAAMKEVPPMPPNIKATDGLADCTEYQSIHNRYMSGRGKARTWFGSGGRLPARATP
jgi:hypothetical protein